MQYAFTVITAVYNSEKYLDDYFESLLVNQSYPTHLITTVLVDDGSTDNTRTIINNWKKRYPDQIKYIYKENGGQSSARNLGLDFAATEWVTFIDSDDFVDENYFTNVAASIQRNPDLVMACCNNIRYTEETGHFTNSHFLNYRFAQGDVFFDINDEKLYPQHSAALAFFKKSILDKSGLRFSERLKVSFEDALFVGNYLKTCESGIVGFLASAKYYARRRADDSSTTNSSFKTPDYFNNCLKYGHLALLNDYLKENKEIPAAIQRSVLYDLTWRIRWHVDGPPTVNCLSAEENAEYIQLLSQIFTYIDIETIQDAPGSVYWYFYKMGLVNYFKDSKLGLLIAYIEHFDTQKKEITFRYFGDKLCFIRNNKPVEPIAEKIIPHSLFGKPFVVERYVRFQYEHLTDIFSIAQPKNNSIQIKYRNKNYTGKSLLYIMSKTHKRRLKYIQRGNIWLVSDGLNKADDNGEHFYRFLQKNHPKQKAYYVLEESSPDWSRLKDEGFNLLPFGTKKYERILKKSEVIISSQILDGNINYFKDYYRGSKKFIFLQHGTIKDDLSPWLNNYWIDLMITSSPREYESIVSNKSNYRLFKDQVALTEQARHDSLLRLANNVPKEKVILVAPTWRKNIVGGLIGGTSQRAINDSFAETEYCKKWSSFLCSKELKVLCDELGYKIVFSPHTNIAPYAEQGFFALPEYVELRTGNVSWQSEFARASLMVTDYSSNAFEMAYLMKPTFYYQFDRDEFEGGAHTYIPGYFDYLEDSFGPVLTTEHELISELKKYCSSFCLDSKHEANIKNCFQYRDGQACARIYKEINRIAKN